MSSVGDGPGVSVRALSLTHKRLWRHIQYRQVDPTQTPEASGALNLKDNPQMGISSMMSTGGLCTMPNRYGRWLVTNSLFCLSKTKGVFSPYVNQPAFLVRWSRWDYTRRPLQNNSHTLKVFSFYYSSYPHARIRHMTVGYKGNSLFTSAKRQTYSLFC